MRAPLNIRVLLGYALHSDLPSPPEVDAAAKVYEAIAAAEVPAPTPPATSVAEAKRQAIEKALSAAAKGKPGVVDYTPVSEAEAEQQEYETALAQHRAQRELQRRAAEVAGVRLVAAVDADEVCRLLDTELRTILDQARQLGDVAAVSASEALRGDEPTRERWRQLDALAARYGALRRAQHAASEGQCEHDAPPVFADIRNADALWPGRGAALGPASVPPWPPSGTPERLAWYCQHPEAEPWCPTPAQRDARWQDAFGEAVNRMAAARARAAGGVYAGA